MADVVSNVFARRTPVLYTAGYVVHVDGMQPVYVEDWEDLRRYLNGVSQSIPRNGGRRVRIYEITARLIADLPASSLPATIEEETGADR